MDKELTTLDSLFKKFWPDRVDLNHSEKIEFIKSLMREQKMDLLFNNTNPDSVFVRSFIGNEITLMVRPEGKVYQIEDKISFRSPGVYTIETDTTNFNFRDLQGKIKIL